MPQEIRVPEIGESIREVQINAWLKEEGQWVEKDENLVEIETEKATVNLPAPVSGVLSKVLKRAGETAEVGAAIGQLDPDAKPRPEKQAAMPEPASQAAPAAAPQEANARRASFVMPAAERALATSGVAAEEVQPTGPGGRMLKEDVLRQAEVRRAKPAAQAPAPAPARPSPAATDGRQEEVVPMSLIRRRIAERLVQAQQTAALLTTFNEIDMTEVIGLRKKYREPFQQEYGVKLGFMSFFVKAVVEGLKAFPAINAEIRANGVVYRNYYDIGIAVGGGKGLVVPVVRDAQRMSFAEIERAIEDFGKRAQANQLTPEELTGGTFTITNGGVYGSLLSTPIINPPQSGILGMHAIQDRPVARDGQVVVRPMMYVALTYDHRIVDGREAVSFLRRVKDLLEDPPRLVLEV